MESAGCEEGGEEAVIHDTPNFADSHIARMWAEEVELLLIKELEKIEGRVPNNDEVSRHGHCLIHCDGARDYQWKGKTVLRIDSWRLSDDWKFVLNYSTPKKP